MFEKIKKIPAPEEVLGALPMPDELKRIKSERDIEISEVICGKSDKFLIIVGPCSAHAEAPVLEYVERLGKLNLKVKDKLTIVPRIYSSKSRTRGVGYMGMISRPDPSKTEDISRGIYEVRRLNLKVMEVSGLTAADEMLYPDDLPYFLDMFSYIAVGARSCENQLHRLAASGIEVPVGFKNPTGGSVSVALDSVFAAQSGHVFKLNEWQVKTTGNSMAHVILRGASDGRGNFFPNYHFESIMQVAEEYSKSDLKNPAVVIDVNHSNSGKHFLQQIRICGEVMQNRNSDKNFKKLVKGLMIESFLEEGSQIKDLIYGKSITDPCLGWKDTERLILDIAEKV